MFENLQEKLYILFSDCEGQVMSLQSTVGCAATVKALGSTIKLKVKEKFNKMCSSVYNDPVLKLWNIQISM
jgi:hypothetical protein